MNKKGLVPIIVIIFLVVVSVVAVGVWSQSSPKNRFLPNLKTNPAPVPEEEKKIEKERPSQEMVDQKITDSLAVSAVKTFCDNFFKAPPALNDAGVMQAIGLLSQKALQSISTIGPSPSAALTYFAGVQDIPDQGFSIEEISEEQEKAIIKTIWKYSSGPVSKVFNLVKENGDWKIDSIQ